MNPTNNVLHYKCRCCLKATVFCIKLESFINIFDNMEKTYKEVLNEITKFEIPPCKEKTLPQQICMECGTQIINSYKFILQACKVAEQYLKLEDTEETQDNFEDFENLQEKLLFEMTEVPIAENDLQEIKENDFSMECDLLVKKEKENSNTTGQQKDRNFLEISSEDSDEPESLKYCDLSKEPIARRCDICQKVYKNEQILKMHKHYTHMPDEDKITCPLCPHKSNKSSSLKLHIGLIHGQDKVIEYFKPTVKEKGNKYPCNFCSRSYVRKYTLHRHIRRKHPKKTSDDEAANKKTPAKPIKPKEKERCLCTYCGKSYSLKSSLKTHVRSHTGERPYVCEICNKTFKRLMGVQLHRVTHSDEKPYKCNACDKSFKLPDKLKYHMRVHSELRPYKCNECDKAFKYACVLKSHMYMHTGETPFECKTCGQSFAMRTSLNKHCLKYNHEK